MNRKKPQLDQTATGLDCNWTRLQPVATGPLVAVLQDSEVDRLWFTRNLMLCELPQDQFGPVSTNLWQVQVTTPQCSADHDRHHTNANGNCDKDNRNKSCMASPSAEPVFNTIQNTSESVSLQVPVGCLLSPILPYLIHTFRSPFSHMDGHR